MIDRSKRISASQWFYLALDGLLRILLRKKGRSSKLGAIPAVSSDSKEGITTPETDPWKQIKFFKPEEFNKNQPELGRKMNIEFVKKLDKLRDICGFPFIINSGYRTKKENDRLIRVGRASRTSSHLIGRAADIHISSSIYRYKIVECAPYVGIGRIGIGINFIHLDDDPDKPDRVMWRY